MSGAMTEFRITSDLAVLRGQVIEANFAEVKDWLDENLEPYRNMAVTPDSIPAAKSYRANIRKVRDRIDESRKEAKNAALAAYQPFEAKCKELTGLCDDAANALDTQIKEFEQREAAEKVERIRSDYIALTDDEIEEYLPWGCVNNPKWMNKGYSFEDAVSEIKTAIEKTRGDLAAIRDMGGEDTAYLLDYYKQTRDLSAVIRKASELKTRRAREEQREREEAERKAAREAERERMAKEAEQISAQSTQHGTDIYVEETPPENVMYSVSFRVDCTKEQLIALGEYMRANGIKYRRCGE